MIRSWVRSTTTATKQSTGPSKGPVEVPFYSLYNRGMSRIDPSTWHILSELDTETEMANCSQCGPVRIVWKEHKGRWKCFAANLQQHSAGASYRNLVGNVCSHCGFVAEHVVQLDVDHIDGNHNNNAPENLQTLCANCHRLKTYK